MEELQSKAKVLLDAGAIKVVIGYGKGTGEARRPIFVTKPERRRRAGLRRRLHAEPGHLPDQARGARHGPHGHRGHARRPCAASCNWPPRSSFARNTCSPWPSSTAQVQELATFDAIEEAVATIPDAIADADRQMIDKLTAMSVAERRAFWADELGRCVKCYACRSRCPMCYCERCTTDCNRPQWIPVASHAVGNLEYHVMRAMHLAGRCVECGTCGAACPVGIPVHLLTIYAEDSVRRQFGQKGGASAKLDYAMSTFKPDDKEEFIR